MGDSRVRLSPFGGRRTLFALGGLYLTLAAGWPLLVPGNPPPTHIVLLAILVGCPGLIILTTSYWLPRSDIHPDSFPTITRWSIGAIGVMLAILLFIAGVAELDNVVENVLILTALASVAGVGTGFQTAKAQTRALIAEERQQEAERYGRELERYETIVEVVNDGVYVVDEDGTFQMVNETYAEMLGYDPADLIGRDASTFLRDTRLLTQIEELHTATEEGQIKQPSMEGELRTASGEWLPVEATFAPIPDVSGGDWYRAGVVRDITDRKERERALEESERRYRTLIEHFPSGAVGLFDEKLQYTAVGGQLLDTAGVDPDERLGRSIFEIYPEDIVEEVEPYFQAALEGDRNTFKVEYHGRDLFNQTLPVRNTDDEVYAGMLVVQDVTEQREYERKLEQSNERLEQFAYAASHDLQEPLRMVSSYLQLIERRYAGELDEDGQEFIEFAVDGAERMRQMIEGLLEYSRVDSQGTSLEPVNLTDILEDVLEDLQMKIQETGADITVEDLPTVEGDVGQLRQVFQNLLDNAIEYSGDAPPHVHISAVRDGDRWTISVSDEGIGIEPAHTEQVFEIFQSLNSREEYDGTGIGLALVERIIERHGGDIWVNSEPGEGTTFSFTLRAVESRISAE